MMSVCDDQAQYDTTDPQHEEEYEAHTSFNSSRLPLATIVSSLRHFNMVSIMLRLAPIFTDR